MVEFKVKLQLAISNLYVCNKKMFSLFVGDKGSLLYSQFLLYGQFSSVSCRIHVMTSIGHVFLSDWSIQMALSKYQNLKPKLKKDINLNNSSNVFSWIALNKHFTPSRLVFMNMYLLCPEILIKWTSTLFISLVIYLFICLFLF